jgi:hypothetical protein
MAKLSKIEPVNIDLYEKAWGHRPQPQKRNNRTAEKKRKFEGDKNKRRSETLIKYANTDIVY